MTVRGRLVAVLGYSTGGADNDLHPVCAARLARAAEEIGLGDAVLFSGWRRGGAVSEAELMARGWSGRAGQVLLDTAARTTYGNIVGAAAAAREVSAREVVVVTSGWHGRRAGALMRAAFPTSGRHRRNRRTGNGARKAQGARLLVARAVPDRPRTTHAIAFEA